MKPEQRKALQTQIAKHICTDLMDDKWSLGRSLYLRVADDILKMVEDAALTPVEGE